jgi:hypothetical protein
MADLSPAARLLAAFWKEPGDRSALAAVLCALADQVAPDEPDYMRAAIHDQGWWDKQDLIRSEILAIAEELKA